MFELDDEGERIEYEKIITETKKAWLLKIERDVEVWLPKTECEIDTTDNTILVPLWIISEKGL